jgi:pyruvate dehydrogenase E1 component alpha subunit
VERARKGEGPSLIECKTYRWMGHSKSDANVYRSKEEIKSWKEKCPIRRFEGYLINNRVASEQEIEKIKREVEEYIQKAEEFALKSLEPSIDGISDGVYA